MDIDVMQSQLRNLKDHVERHLGPIGSAPGGGGVAAAIDVADLGALNELLAGISSALDDLGARVGRIESTAAVKHYLGKPFASGQD